MFYCRVGILILGDSNSWGLTRGDFESWEFRVIWLVGILARGDSGLCCLTRGLFDSWAVDSWGFLLVGFFCLLLMFLLAVGRIVQMFFVEKISIVLLLMEGNCKGKSPCNCPLCYWVGRVSAVWLILCLFTFLPEKKKYMLLRGQSDWLWS